MEDHLERGCLLGVEGDGSNFAPYPVETIQLRECGTVGRGEAYGTGCWTCYLAPDGH